MSSSDIRVLIVDDSAVVRGLLARALETEPGIVISGTAMHGVAALSNLRHNPADIVILDVEMPVMSGLEVLPKILEEFPRTRVIMASSLTVEGGETTVRALALGAAGCIAKPQTTSLAGSIQQLVQELVPLVKALAPRREEKPVASGSFSKRDAAQANASYNGAPAVLVIGTSTGGPNALSALLSKMPTNFSLPTLIVQHMPPMFTPMLARHLQQDSGRPCREAVEGGELERGHIYVAPGDYHMSVVKRGDRMVTTLDQAPPEHYCRPSVNPLFRSAAEWYGSGVLAVMLTGMGDDGIEGTRTIRARNGYIIAQDEASSVVWGMPGAVVRENLANVVLPLNEIAREIVRVARRETVLR